MRIQADTVVGIEYILRDDDDKVVDSSDGDPLYYLHGHDNIVVGLEEKLAGCSVGDEIKVTVPPEKGYGARREDLVQEVPRSAVQGSNLQKGMELMITQGNDRQMPFRIVKVKPQTLVLDGNHELAGQTLHFSVKVREVRRATKEELAHGHAHPHGHHEH